MQLPDKTWFSEAMDEYGVAFSLKVSGKLHEEQTQYQKIEIYQTETFGKLMVIDGCTMLSDRDNFLYHEMMSHPAIFTHPAPRRVVIIGGGDCGTLREVLKHDEIESVVQIDIDERVTRLAEQYFPALCDANDDPRAQLLFEDGIQWIQRAEPGSVDLIIVDSTDPVGPAEGLFNAPFYRDCLRALGTGGLLVQQSESPLIHVEIMKSMRQQMLAAGFVSTQPILFPQTIYPSGWWSATIASAMQFDFGRYRPFQPGQFETFYYTTDIHRGALALPPFLERVLA